VNASSIAALGAGLIGIAFGGYGLSTIPASDPAVDTTEHTFVVCLNGEKPLYTAIVKKAYVSRYVRIIEDGGLERDIINATCVITRGTQAQFEAAQAETEVSSDPVGTE
jgi:hypothetical protein